MRTAHDLALLNRILEAVRLVESRSRGDAHLTDVLLADAILWRTGVILQDAERLSAGVMLRHPGVDWRALHRLRRVADGDLGGVTRDEVWVTLRRVLPSLRTAVEDEIARLHNSSAGEERVRRVLLVDDDRDIRRILDLLLSHAGFEVIEASSGAEALTSAEETRPDAIIADVQMPGMDGIDLVRRVRDMPDMARVPVVLFTDRPPHGGVSGPLSLYRVRYMSKGDPDRIATALEEMFADAIAG